MVTEQANGGPSRRLVGLELDWRAIVDQHLNRDAPPNISPRVRWEEAVEMDRADIVWIADGLIVDVVGWTRR